MNKPEAESLLRRMLGADKSFREGQWEAIHAAAVLKQRVLVVQRIEVATFLFDVNYGRH